MTMSGDANSTDLLTHLGRQVRTRREESGMTRKALATQAGLSERFVAEVEAGRGNISILKLDQLAQVLGVPCVRLLTREEAAKPVIALLGLRGAGKTSVGKGLAEKLHVPFVELDALVEAEAGM